MARNSTVGQRVVGLDLMRSFALLCMVIFHLTFDLMLFGHLAPGIVFQGIWPWFARSIASSFLILAGLSLWLAHGSGIRWATFWRRFAILVLAAAGISIGTYYAMGPQFIRWGILHMIAAGSLIGLAVLRLPNVVTLLIAMGAFAAPYFLRHEVFDAPLLLWVGLSKNIPPMMDYEPVLPWLCPLLIGIVLAKLLSRSGVWARLATWSPGPLIKVLAWPGKHSLAIYLIHQPILFGGIYLWTMGMGSLQ